jgi:hypothetical protein
MNTACRGFPEKFSGIFFFIFSFLISSGQILDSIRASFHAKPKLTGGFATKTSFIDGFSSPVFSAHAGVDFNNHIRFGAGISWLKLSGYKPGRNNSPFYLDKIMYDSAGNISDTVHPALSFVYGHLIAEYIFFRTEKWQFGIPLKAGIGNSKYRYSYSGKEFTESKHFIMLYEPAVAGNYKFLRWLGAGIEAGYRLMLVNNKAIGSSFNSPVYDAKVIIFWGELYRNVFGRKP